MRNPEVATVITFKSKMKLLTIIRALSMCVFQKLFTSIILFFIYC